ncbi:hypothetical protein MRB53_026882 [Persea americana]|uniref:Uncharacterized protein n=2 Tax=Persea americana TaxID=3435 RepID=A0ACC2LKM7_PERAE|nr:hypothetical protein MRB53_026881 [Persea americana]KAJ8633546.1 hypothetical protein MRB53_026882 [Persea americana]
MTVGDRIQRERKSAVCFGGRTDRIIRPLLVSVPPSMTSLPFPNPNNYSTNPNTNAVILNTTGWHSCHFTHQIFHFTKPLPNSSSALQNTNSVCVDGNSTIEHVLEEKSSSSSSSFKKSQTESESLLGFLVSESKALCVYELHRFSRFIFQAQDLILLLLNLSSLVSQLLSVIPK